MNGGIEGSGPRTTGLLSYDGCDAGLKIGYHQSSHSCRHTLVPLRSGYCVSTCRAGWEGGIRLHFSCMEPAVSGWKSGTNNPVQNNAKHLVFLALL